MSDVERGPSPLFLSYASSDQARVDGIAAALASAGLPVWIDRDGIAGGASYGSEIAAAIREAPAFLLCLTPAALASRNVRQEIALAWKHERSIIPLLLEPTDIPPDLEYWLEATQWIEVLKQHQAAWLPRLVAALSGTGLSVPKPFEISPTPHERSQATVHLPLLPPAVIGRDREIAEVADLLRSGARLLTLTGPGGVGKTTLAIAAAQTLTDHFLDGIFFIDLAPVRAIDNAISTIAQSLGIRELGIETAAQDLAAHLSGKRTLLIFDNTEHLDRIGSSIEDLLAGARETTALVTSRRPLHVRGEREMPINTLPVATIGSGIAEIELSASVQMFLSRAEQSAPGLGVDNTTLLAVSTICERLDGLPLAIELAAARLRIYSPAQLLAKLDQGLAVLGGDSAHASGRQRTLAEAVAWSVNLLTPAERALFSRLAVFVGGCTLAAAEAVAVAPSELFGEEIDLLAGIDSLVDNSLLTRQVTVDGEVRFGMLATIYDIARHMLDESDEAVEIRNRHADWCKRYSAEVALLERDFATLSKVRAAANDLPNFRAAFSWLAQTEDDATYKRIASNLTILWTMFDGQEIEAILLQAPNREETADPQLRADYLRCLLEYPSKWLPTDEATQHGKLNELQNMYERLGDRYGEAQAHFRHSEIYAGTNDWAAANRELDIAAEIWTEIDQPDWLAIALIRKGAFAFYAGDLSEAVVWNEKARGIYNQPYATLEVNFALQWKAVIDVPNEISGDGCQILMATLQYFRAMGSISMVAGWTGAACGYLLLLGDASGKGLIDEVIRIQDAMGFYYEYMLPDPRRIKKMTGGDRDEETQPSKVLTLIQIADLLESRLRELSQHTPTRRQVSRS